MAIVITLAILLALIAAGTVYEALARRGDARRYPPPGMLVDIGGYRLHLHCAGQGGPAVLLDSGLGDSSAVWAFVQQEAARTTRVCSYDRAGLGWSDPGPKPRTYQRAAEELHTLIQKAGIQPPFILVGHSAGANTVRLFAQSYPGEVAGLVLVEPPILKEVRPAFVGIFRLLRAGVGGLSRIGGIRLLGRLSLMSLLFAGAKPPAGLSRQAGFLYRPQTIRASIDEVDALPESIRLVNQTVGPGAWDPWPVTIIAAYRGDSPSERQTRPLKELASLSTRGKLVAVKSSHFVHFEHPEAVIQAIEEIGAASR
jgi:pimeloyl-ACP methyl ester carboxylesterase